MKTKEEKAESKRKSNQKWYAANKEKAKAWSREHYLKNRTLTPRTPRTPEQVAAQKELKAKKAAKRYVERTPEQVAAQREYNRKRSAEKKRVFEEMIHAFWQVAQVRWQGKRTRKQQVQDALEQTAWRNNWREKHLKTT